MYTRLGQDRSFNQPNNKFVCWENEMVKSKNTKIMAANLFIISKLAS